MKRVLRAAARLAAPLLWKKFFLGSERAVWPKGKAAVTVSFDLDYPEDIGNTPGLLETLDSFGMKASFACIGKWIEKYPSQHLKIFDRGHEIINHTYSHPNNELLNPTKYFVKLSEREQEEEIKGFEQAAQAVLGYKPAGFRAPHFGDLNSQSVYEVLERRDYLYSSSTNLATTKSKGLPYRPSRTNFRRKDEANGYALLELPLMACPEHFFPVFDSWHCYRSKAHAKEGEFFKVFREAVAMAQKRGAYANFYFDPRDIAGKKDLEESLEWLGGQDVWTAPSKDVAGYWVKK